MERNEDESDELYKKFPELKGATEELIRELEKNPQKKLEILKILSGLLEELGVNISVNSENTVDTGN